jgi:hypothetical protein
MIELRYSFPNIVHVMALTLANVGFRNTAEVVILAWGSKLLLRLHPKPPEVAYLPLFPIPTISQLKIV